MVRACFNGAAGYSIWRKLILEVACISRTTADHAYARNYLTWHRIIVNILLIWCQSVNRFLSLSSMLEPELTIGGVSICPSVCLSHSHTRINSKLMTVVSCSRHRRVAQGLLFFVTNFHTLRLRETPLQELHMQLRNGKKRRFSTSKSLYLRNDRRGV